MRSPSQQRHNKPTSGHTKFKIYHRKMTSVQIIDNTCDDIDVYGTCVDDNERFFYEVIGCIEDIIMKESFQLMQRHFLEKHCDEFEDKEENKLIYTDIFKEYEEKVERFIHDNLLERMPHFNMDRFEKELKIRKDDLDGEIFEILATFSNFLSFKNMFIDYKRMKEDKLAELANHISVSKYNVTKHD